MLNLSRSSDSLVPNSGVANGGATPNPDHERPNELPEHLERDFDRRALVPRLLVLTILGAAAILEYGHGHRGAIGSFC